MDLEISKPLTTLNPANPITAVELAKLGLNVYLGQALKAVVMTPLSNGELTININGNNLNAQSSHKFNPGDVLNLQVVKTDKEIVLQIQQENLPQTDSQKLVLQNALLQALPKQAPPQKLLAMLEQIVESDKLPEATAQQVKALLSSLPALSQLPQQLAKVIKDSGVFLESSLLEWKPGDKSDSISSDLKGQLLKLLDTLQQTNLSPTLPSNKALAGINIQQDTIPLPGAIPQPIHKEGALDLTNTTPATLQNIIHEQVTQALSRITANQINHLNADDNNKNGFVIMLDIPIKTTSQDIDVIPLMIQQRKATPTQPAQWSMSFAVSLSNLGDIQGTATLHNDEVFVKMNTELPKAMQIIQGSEQELTALLGQLGLNLSGLNIKLGLENNAINTAELNLLDIRI